MNYSYFGADVSLTKADLDWFLFFCQSLNTDLSYVMSASPAEFFENRAKIIEDKVALYNYAIQKFIEVGPSNQSVIDANGDTVKKINDITKYLPAKVVGIQQARPKAVILPEGAFNPVPKEPSTVYAFAPMLPPPAGSILSPSTTLQSSPIVNRGVSLNTFNIDYSAAQKIQYNIPANVNTSTAKVSPATGTVSPTPMPNSSPSTAGVVAGAPAVKSDATLPLIIAGGAVAALLLLK